MDVSEVSVPLAENDPSSLVDVLSVPTIGAEVLSRLSDKSALRQTCAVICAMVRHWHGVCR
jgi:hypothetical protein